MPQMGASRGLYSRVVSSTPQLWDSNPQLSSTPQLWSSNPQLSSTPQLWIRIHSCVFESTVVQVVRVVRAFQDARVRWFVYKISDDIHHQSISSEDHYNIFLEFYLK